MFMCLFVVRLICSKFTKGDDEEEKYYFQSLLFCFVF